jgi:steroid delta-isomerase-like uncharacterized protein
MSLSNKNLIRRIIEQCFNQHNIDVYPDFYSKHFIQRTGAFGDLAAVAHRRLLVSIFNAFPDAHWNIVDQISEGDLAVTRWTLVGTHLGKFMGFAATGKHMSSRGIRIDRIRSGKVIEEWEEWDTLGMMQQLGAVTMTPARSKATA